MDEPEFEWDFLKDLENQIKHGVSFKDACHAFSDPDCVISEDPDHSHVEERLFCYGLDQAMQDVLTVRFTFRVGRIRIIGAGYWRKGRKLYDKENQIY